MDFVADALFDGRKLRILTVVDNFKRQCFAIEVELTCRGRMCAGALNNHVLTESPRTDQVW